MLKKHQEELKREISHIFDSGANETRIFEMVSRFIDLKSNEVNIKWIDIDENTSSYPTDLEFDNAGFSEIEGYGKAICLNESIPMYLTISKSGVKGFVNIGTWDKSFRIKEIEANKNSINECYSFFTDKKINWNSKRTDFSWNAILSLIPLEDFDKVQIYLNIISKMTIYIPIEHRLSLSSMLKLKFIIKEIDQHYPAATSNSHNEYIFKRGDSFSSEQVDSTRRNMFTVTTASKEGAKILIDQHSDLLEKVL